MSTISSQPNLLEWFARQPKERFPPDHGTLYPDRLQQVTGKLNSEVHPHVAAGAALADGNFLTDHGPAHIGTVIQRASFLLSHPKCSFPQFSPYEIYILLLAIHFHDVGNILGRANHESHAEIVMNLVKDIVGDETVERRAILRIAEVHGGRIDGKKDTISSLNPVEFVLGERIRCRALAALLRFADELADDCHRAARYASKLKVIPAESEIFHAYAKSLHSVVVEPQKHVVHLRYSLLRDEATRTYGKVSNNKEVDQVYLLDEIYERTIKMHLERMYCMRFLRGIIFIDRVDVSIEVFETESSPTPCIDAIGYTLQEEGYPVNDFARIQERYPKIGFDGCSLSKHLQNGA